MTNQPGIDIYPVGLLLDIRNHRLRHGLRRFWRLVRQHKWRAARNCLNGYLAEWDYPPDGVMIYRCGRGWTKRAALRRLGIHIAKSNRKGQA